MPIYKVLILFLLFITTSLNAGNFDLVIMHTNDMHSKLLPSNDDYQLCQKHDYKKCVGGVARLHTKINHIRKKYSNTLLLDSGDQFQGSFFYSYYRGKAAQHFMNALGYDAMVIGNHEFDDGPKNLSKFAGGLNFPLLSANTDCSKHPQLKEHVLPFKIFTKNGKKIAVIGYTTEETAILSASGTKIKFKNIEKTLRKLIKRLKKKEKIDIFIGLSHSGFARDRKVAKAIGDFDVIISAHSHTFLSNRSNKAQGPYPTVVTSKKGKKVLLVSAHAYGRYLGFLQLHYKNNQLASWQGEPILMDHTVAANTDISAKLHEMYKPFKKLQNQTIFTLNKSLEGREEICRHKQCALGSVLADSLVATTKHMGVNLAIINSGSVRASMAKGKVTRANISTILPFDKNINIVTLSGRTLLKVFEHSVSRADNLENDGTGRFLQVSGFHLKWDKSAKVGKRVKSLAAVNKNGKMVKVKKNKIYKIAADSFICNGGDGYHMIHKEAIDIYDHSISVSDVFVKYLTENKNYDANYNSKRITQI